jgi:hypothetical protein
MAADSAPLEILSTFGTDSVKCDSRAFAALLRHVRAKDGKQQTVLMVQVENEVGFLGSGRDRSPEANRQFVEPSRDRRLAKKKPYTEDDPALVLLGTINRLATYHRPYHLGVSELFRRNR